MSTAQQGASGLGLEAQRETVAQQLRADNGTLAREVVEIESGKRSDRAQLAEALRQCRLHKATLIVAKVDRLARDVEFLRKIVRESGEAGIVFCDLPAIPAGAVGKFILTQMAATAELEAGLISQRTKAALNAARARGAKLGGLRGDRARMAEVAQAGAAASAKVRTMRAHTMRNDLLPVVDEIRESGRGTFRAIASELNNLGHRAPRGGLWSSGQVASLLRASVPQGAEGVQNAA